jgi:cytochrome c oxidase subunit 2
LIFFFEIEDRHVEVVLGYSQSSGPTAAVVAMSSFGGAAFAENVSGQPLQYNLVEPVTEIARQIYDLHTLMLVICLVIFFAVFGVMFYSIYAHRKSKGAKSASFHESVKVEIAWTIVPFLIVIGMALARYKNCGGHERHV